MALLSIRERAGAQALLEEVTYVELSDRPDFNDRFVDQLAFRLSDVALIACGAHRPAGRRDRRRAAAGRSTSTRCRRCCTTSRS